MTLPRAQETIAHMPPWPVRPWRRDTGTRTRWRARMRPFRPAKHRLRDDRLRKYWSIGTCRQRAPVMRLSDDFFYNCAHATRFRFHRPALTSRCFRSAFETFPPREITKVSSRCTTWNFGHAKTAEHSTSFEGVTGTGLIARLSSRGKINNREMIDRVPTRTVRSIRRKNVCKYTAQAASDAFETLSRSSSEIVVKVEKWNIF
jgi:hypothetical protein